MAKDIGLTNDIVPLDQLDDTAQKWVDTPTIDATFSHADHKKLLRIWSSEGMKSADKAMLVMIAKLLQSEGVRGSLIGAIEAVKAGLPCSLGRGYCKEAGKLSRIGTGIGS